MPITKPSSSGRGLTPAGLRARGLGGSGTASTFPRWAGIDDRRLLVQALVGLAAIAADHEQCDQAAMLLGAADRRWDDVVMAMRGSLGAKRDADDSRGAGGTGRGPLCGVADRRVTTSALRKRWPLP